MNPLQEAIDKALKPKNTLWLYFVRNLDNLDCPGIGKACRDGSCYVYNKYGQLILTAIPSNVGVRIKTPAWDCYYTLEEPLNLAVAEVIAKSIKESSC